MDLRIVFIFSVICIIDNGTGYKILGLFPPTGKSHYMIFEPLLKELALRGHEVKVLGVYPSKEKLNKFNFIGLKSPESEDNGSFNFPEAIKYPTIGDVVYLTNRSFTICKELLGHEKIQDLVNSDEKFDLILYEIFVHDCFLPIIGKLKSPHIALSTTNLFPWYFDNFGFIDNPNYIPNIFLHHSIEMSFVECLVNSLFTSSIKVIWSWYVRSNHQAMAEKYIHAPVPKIEEVMRETSLVLINSHFTVAGARPMGPNFIEIAGIHFGKPGNLSQDLKKWMDSSDHGVIYFSMGSMLRGSTLPDSKRNAIMEVFKGLKQRILWKWEESEIPIKADNVRIETWLPQREVLAHPKTKAFITHCGMLSTVEAIDSGVPTLCIPMYGDQFSNQRGMELKGISVFLDYNKINTNYFRQQLETVLQPEYKKRALVMQRAFRDRPMSPLDTSIYWIEYVARQKGADHLKLATRHLNWTQKFLLDLILIYISLLLILIFILRWIGIKLLFLIKKDNKIKKH